MKLSILFLVLIMFLAISPSKGQEATPYGNNPSAGGYVIVNGIEMYYEIYGTGEPLVFIHGNGGSMSNFYGQIPFFSKPYTRPDLEPLLNSFSKDMSKFYGN